MLFPLFLRTLRSHSNLRQGQRRRKKEERREEEEVGEGEEEETNLWKLVNAQ